MKLKRRCEKAPAKILCIDDEVENLKVLASALKDDYQIILAKSATQGLEVALENQPDLILLDIVMPDISGFDLLRALKKEPSLEHVPVIFVTGLQSEADEERGLLLGASDYIHKPFSFGIVKARVHTHLEILRQRKLLENFAHFDHLTELPNRRKWTHDSDEVWSLSLANAERLTLGVIDIDHFKLYNDRYGHQHGDIALRRVSNAINRLLFNYRGGVYRCGGEEFFFYFSGAYEKSSQSILNECIQMVQNLEIKHDASLTADVVTVSIGAVTLIPSITCQLESTMASADKLLYQVKSDGRNAARVMYPNEMKDGQVG